MNEPHSCETTLVPKLDSQSALVTQPARKQIVRLRHRVPADCRIVELKQLI